MAPGSWTYRTSSTYGLCRLLLVPPDITGQVVPLPYFMSFKLGSLDIAANSI